MQEIEPLCVQQVYSRLTERLGMTDHLMVLNAMLGKIAVNLKVYGPVEDLIQQTLSLFQVALFLQLDLTRLAHCENACWHLICWVPSLEKSSHSKPAQ